MNDPKIRSFAAPASVTVLLLTTIFLYNMERPKPDSGKLLQRPEANLRVDEKATPATDSAIASVGAELPTSTETIVTNSIGMQ